MMVMYIHGCDFASNNLSAWCEQKVSSFNIAITIFFLHKLFSPQVLVVVMAEVVKATIPTSKRETMRGKNPGATALTKVATLKCMPF